MTQTEPLSLPTRVVIFAAVVIILGVGQVAFGIVLVRWLTLWALIPYVPLCAFLAVGYWKILREMWSWEY